MERIVQTRSHENRTVRLFSEVRSVPKQEVCAYIFHHFDISITLYSTVYSVQVYLLSWSATVAIALLTVSLMVTIPRQLGQLTKTDKEIHESVLSFYTYLS